MSGDTIAAPRTRSVAAAVGVLVMTACAGGGVDDTTIASTTSTTVPGRLTNSTTSTVPVTTTTVDPEARALVVAESGLAAWGQYAVSGDTALLSRYFSTSGPQYQLFVAEADDLAADPLGSPPYTFTLTNVAFVPSAAQANRDVLRADVQVTRVGEEAQEFRWDLHLDQSAAGVTIWTVSNTDSSQTQAATSSLDRG